MTVLSPQTPTHLIVGPSSHGVTRYARELADACGGPVIREESFGSGELPGFVHVTFTDHLFGPSPDAAVDALLARIGENQLSLSFHDIPQPEEGADRYARRAGAYERLARAAIGSGGVAVVNSEHEAAFFGDIPVDVIRLPIPVIDSPYEPEPGTVGILGFLYPGKGHEDIIDALHGSDYRLRFLGSVSEGHEEWAQGLADHADITGWLSDADLDAEMGRIQVPVCAHKHFSASGSLMTWLGAGRHVLASDSTYTREIDTWLPGRITRVADGQWRTAIDAFAASPPPPLDPPHYGWSDVAAQWAELWAALWNAPRNEAP